jgi:hypothetical protein
LFSGYVYNNQVERFPLVFISAGILPAIALFLLLRMVNKKIKTKLNH